MNLQNQNRLQIIQRKELAEFFGFESRNKYAILGEQGDELAFAAEQQKGLLGFFMRQWFGHWRTFDILIFGSDRNPLLNVHHPFRFLFQRVEVTEAGGRFLGALQQRFSLLSKCFDVIDRNGRELFQVRSPLWTPWTFSFERDGRRLALVKKRWSGLFTEALTDADRFGIQFESSALSSDEKALVLAGALFVDLKYFETKANRD